MTPDVAAIAAGLDPEQLEAFRAIGEEWGRTGASRHNSRARVKLLRRMAHLIEWTWGDDAHRYRLTPLGLAVRAHILEDMSHG